MAGSDATTVPGPTRRDVARLLGLLLVVLGALRLAGWHLRALVSPWSDLRAYFLPKYQWAADRIAAGELPLWNPLEFGGIPFLATIQPGVFYPPLRIAYALVAGEHAYDVLFVLHVLLGAVGTLWLARRVGLGPWPSVFAALWVTQPTWLIQIYDHPVFVFAVAWIPVLVLLTRHAVLRPSARAAALLGGAAAVQASSGYPPYALATGYVLLLGIPVWLLEARGRGGGARLGRVATAFVGAGALAALVAAAQLLPAIELLSLTNRALESSAMQAGLTRLEPELVSLFNFPQATLGASLAELWARGGPGLVGLAGLALVLGVRRPVTWWAAGAVVLCGVFPQPWYRVLPFYDLVRFGQEWRFTSPLTTYLLAAIGLDAVLGRWRVSGRAAATLTLVAVATATAWNWRQVPSHWLPPAELGAPPLPAWVERTCALDPERDRAYWVGGQQAAALFRARVPSVGGYEQSLLPARAAVMARALGVGNGAPVAGWATTLAAAGHLASRASLRCVLAPSIASSVLRDASFATRGRRRGSALLVNERVRPRARLAYQTVVASSADEALELAAHAPLDTVVLEGAASPPLAPCARGVEGTVVLRTVRPEDLRLDVTSQCAAYVVLADTWYPGWTATIDGAPATIHRADYAFRAVHVPAGRHEIRLRYEPGSVRAGLALSGVGLVLCVLCAFVGRSRGPALARGADTGGPQGT